jgi:alpha-L-fucosidase
MGPMRDVVGDWQRAAQKHGLRFGVSEHLGASFTWWQSNRGADKTGPKAGVPYDGASPEFQDLYHPAATPGDTAWYSTNPAWHREWFDRIKDLVDQYHPDLLYTDGGLPFGETGRNLVAHFYNANLARNGGRLEAVYTCKAIGSGEFAHGECVQDMERGVLSAVNPLPWQTDTSIGDWFYNRDWKFRPVSWVIHMLVDIVSRTAIS